MLTMLDCWTNTVRHKVHSVSTYSDIGNYHSTNYYAWCRKYKEFLKELSLFPLSLYLWCRFKYNYKVCPCLLALPGARVCASNQAQSGFMVLNLRVLWGVIDHKLADPKWNVLLRLRVVTNHPAQGLLVQSETATRFLDISQGVAEPSLKAQSQEHQCTNNNSKYSSKFLSRQFTIILFLLYCQR